MKKMVSLVLVMLLLAVCAMAEYEEDGQNPVMNLIGPYVDEVSQRAEMTIECEGQDGALVTISWASSAMENTQWRFSGIFNGEDNTITYENCVKINQLFDEAGNCTEEIVYENGTGKLTVQDDWSILWTNDMEETGNDCVFVGN